MNDTTREADRAVPETDADAVERLANAIFDVDRSMFPDYVRHIPARTIYLDRARAALAAVPEPDAAGDDLDALLDSVHPECRVERTIRVEGQWDARIAWPLEPIQEPHQESIWDRQEGTGPTRMDAIADAVRQAKESDDV